MDDDIDFPSDFEFDDLSEETADFDGGTRNVRTAVLRKNEMVALLCLKTASAGAAICRVDPRENQPSVQLYDDPDRALKWFMKSLRTSERNGWQVVYDGLPLQG